MKDLFSKLDKAFEHRIRLAIMSMLMVRESMSFNEIKEQLEITDGNLASHAGNLEKREYVEISKVFVGKKPLTTYAATATGKKAFRQHLDALEELLKGRS